MSVPVGEPVARSWHPRSAAALLDLATAGAEVPTRRPRVVAVDGRGGSGKSTLAQALLSEVERSAVVHTDDVAWHEPLFAWSHLLVQVLAPLREGQAVNVRPPAWARHGRDGAISVPAGLDLVVVEGTGAGQRQLAGLLDGLIWVQADFAQAERRGIDRDVASGVNGDREEATAFWHHWMAAELEFMQRERPWERADAVVAGTPPIAVGPGEWAVAATP